VASRALPHALTQDPRVRSCFARLGLPEARSTPFQKPDGKEIKHVTLNKPCFYINLLLDPLQKINKNLIFKGKKLLHKQLRVSNRKKS
jgi:hypothetical protein